MSAKSLPAAASSSPENSLPTESTFGIPARVINGTTMVSYHDYVNYPGLNLTCRYAKKKKILEIHRNNLHCKLYIGKRKMVINEEMSYRLPAATRLVKQKNGKKILMLPAKKVSSLLRLNYHYDRTEKRVILSPKKPKTTSRKNIQASAFMRMSTEQFILYMAPVIMSEYRRSGGILPSVTLAQAIQESYTGCSLLAQKANNIFGMKASLSGNNWKGSAWGGKVFTKRTREQYGHRVVTIRDRFRKYSNVNKNIRDHAAYFNNAKKGRRKRYAGISSTHSYKKQLKILRRGGYCTFSNYTKALERHIKKYKLTRYDH
jgi:flagellum-specific peptidoglycan hydrolase FlgJ